MQGTVRPLNLELETKLVTMGKNTRSGRDATLVVNAADYKKMEQENKQLRKDIGNLPKDHEKLKEDYGKLEHVNKNLVVKVADLQKQMEKMCKKGHRKGTKCRKADTRRWNMGRV